MSHRWTEDDVRRVRARQQAPPSAEDVRGILKQAKPSKYKNQKTTVDGICFDSKKEAQRYHELKLMEKAGQITALTVQPEYELSAKSGGVVGIYRGDFFYLDANDEVVVEDVKGMASLPLAKWKQKHLRLQYGITVREIR